MGARRNSNKQGARGSGVFKEAATDQKKKAGQGTFPASAAVMMESATEKKLKRPMMMSQEYYTETSNTKPSAFDIGTGLAVSKEITSGACILASQRIQSDYKIKKAKEKNSKQLLAGTGSFSQQPSSAHVQSNQNP